MEMDEFKTIKDIALLLKVSPSTVYRLINSGVLACITLSPRIRRVKLSEVFKLKNRDN